MEHYRILITDMNMTSTELIRGYQLRIARELKRY